MTFSIVAAGPVDQARAQVEASRTYGPDAQFDVVKAFILDQLTGIETRGADDGFEQGVFIEANGHNGYGAPPYVSLSIRPLCLRKAVEESVEVTG